MEDLVEPAPGVVVCTMYCGSMSESRILTADEMLAMSPGDRAEAGRDGIVTDPEAVPADLLARARRKVDAHIAAQEGNEVSLD